MKIKELSMLLENLYSKPYTKIFIKEVEYPAKSCFKEVWEDGTILKTYFYESGVSKTFLNGKYLFGTIPK